MVRPEQLAIFMLLDSTVISFVVALILVVIAAWLADRAPGWMHLALGAVFLAVLFIPAGIMEAEYPPGGFLDTFKLAWYTLLTLSPLVTGNLLYMGLSRAGRKSVAFWLLGLALFAKALHSIYWLIIWDETNDPLGMFWVFLPVLFAVIAGLMLLFRLRARNALAGLVGLLVGPACLIGVFLLAQQVDFKALTDQRAQRVAQAVLAYAQRTGSYPAALDQLPWWQRLTLPGPINFYGQDWCYRGGADYYRLGYLDREHWSSPIRFGRVASSQGHDPNTSDVCQAAIDAYFEQTPGLKQTLQIYGKPTPTPDIGH